MLQKLKNRTKASPTEVLFLPENANFYKKMPTLAKLREYWY